MGKKVGDAFFDRALAPQGKTGNITQHIGLGKFS